MGTSTKILDRLQKNIKATSCLSQNKSVESSSKQLLRKAEEISDELEVLLKDLDENIYHEILQELIKESSEQNDYEIKEVLLNSVANAMSQRDCIEKLDLSSLIKQIDSLKGDCLLHVLDIIGLARNLSYVEVVRRFLKHSNLEVRETAEIALSELESFH